jgi:hypothetical protein
MGATTVDVWIGEQSVVDRFALGLTDATEAGVPGFVDSRLDRQNHGEVDLGQFIHAAFEFAMDAGGIVLYISTSFTTAAHAKSTRSARATPVAARASSTSLAARQHQFQIDVLNDRLQESGRRADVEQCVVETVVPDVGHAVGALGQRDPERLLDLVRADGGHDDLDVARSFPELDRFLEGVLVPLVQVVVDVAVGNARSFDFEFVL